MRQLVIVFDVKVSEMDKNSTLRKEGAVALLNSTGSTYVHTKDSNVEIEPTGVIISIKYFKMLFKIV